MPVETESRVILTAEDRTRAAFASVERSLSGTASKFKNFAGIFGAAFSVAAAVAFTKSAIDAADQLNDLSAALGVSASKLSEYQIVLAQTGGSVEDLVPAFKSVAKIVNEALNNSLSDSAKFLENLGVEFRGRQIVDVFEDLASVIGKASDQDPNKINTLTTAFGKSGLALSAFTKEFENTGAAAREAGLVMSEQFVKDADRFNDALARAGAGFKVFVGTILSGIFSLKDQLEDPFLRLTKRIEGLREQLEQLRKDQEAGGFAGLLVTDGLIARKEAELAAVQAELAKQQQTLQRQLDTGPPEPPIAALPTPPRGKDAASEAAQRERDKALKDAIKAEDDRLKNARDQQAEFIRLSSDLSSRLIADQILLTDSTEEQSALRLQLIQKEFADQLAESNLSTAQRESLQKQFEDVFKIEVEVEAKFSRGALESLLAAWRDTTRRLDEASADWVNGFSEILTDFISGAEVSFKDFVASILRDLARIRIQSALAGIAESTQGSGLGAIFGFLAGAREEGGPVTGGRPYLVGEQGPEVFIPGASGNIATLDSVGSNVSVTLNLSAGVSQTVRAEVAQMLPGITDSVKNAVAEARLRGGRFSSAFT